MHSHYYMEVSNQLPVLVTCVPDKDFTLTAVYDAEWAARKISAPAGNQTLISQCRAFRSNEFCGA
jgi:hypothetical protein